VQTLSSFSCSQILSLIETLSSFSCSQILSLIGAHPALQVIENIEIPKNNKNVKSKFFELPEQYSSKINQLSFFWIAVANYVRIFSH